MFTAQDCRQLADQCRQWAAKSETDLIRKVFLEMARDLMDAASREENGTALESAATPR
jgi:hypothetical protein